MFGKYGEGITTEYIVREVLLGVTICFAQIPESVAFAFMANIKPPIALHAAWIVGFICSAFGGRPGMVNGATGGFWNQFGGGSRMVGTSAFSFPIDLGFHIWK